MEKFLPAAYSFHTYINKSIGREIKAKKIVTHFVLCVGVPMIQQVKHRRLNLQWLFAFFTHHPYTNYYNNKENS